MVGRQATARVGEGPARSTKGEKMKDPLSKENGMKVLKEISDHLKAAYIALDDWDGWQEIETDLAMQSALSEAVRKAREGFAIVELARRRLKELMEMDTTERSTTS